LEINGKNIDDGCPEKKKKKQLKTNHSGSVINCLFTACFCVLLNQTEIDKVFDFICNLYVKGIL
jgi:hypothetical protein